MSDLQLSSDQGEGAATTAHGPSRDPSEATAIDTNNLNAMFDRILDQRTKSGNRSFLQEQPDFKEMQTRRGSLMQNLWESIARSPSQK